MTKIFIVIPTNYVKQIIYYARLNIIIFIVTTTTTSTTIIKSFQLFQL